jgi:hypothetical protein
MLPELSLLHEGSATTEPPRIRPISTRAPRGTFPERPARPEPPVAVASRPSLTASTALSTLDVRGVGRAPRWSLLALQREVELQHLRGGAGGSEEQAGLARRVLVPAAVGAATVVGLVALAGLLVALGLVAAVAVALSVVARLRVTQRWYERQRLLQLDNEALRLRARLVSRLHREHRDELECLVALVENVREHEILRTGSTHGCSTLVARLDALLLSYVERAIEVRGVAAGFAVTLDDEPKLLEPRMPADPDDREGDAERRRALQILHLRRRARELCRRRIERMERELACIGQLVRLVHEQALASGLTHDELSGLLADVLDEAEHARQAREEVEATLDERNLRSEAAASPSAG